MQKAVFLPQCSGCRKALSALLRLQKNLERGVLAAENPGRTVLAAEKPWARCFGSEKLLGALFWLRKSLGDKELGGPWFDS